MKYLMAGLFYICTTLTALAGDWPHWRGPHQNGTTDETGLPTTWSTTENIAWRLALPGPAPATPVTWGDKIFLASARGTDVVLICAETSGKLLWEQKISGGNADIRMGESNAAAPSPTTDGKHVWAMSGTGALACFDVQGTLQWQIDLASRYGAFEILWGMAISPLLSDGRLYLTLLHDTAQKVVALDANSGKEIWAVDRPTEARVECLHGYASPIMYEWQGRRQLISHGSDYIVGHDLKDGREIWRCGGFQDGGYDIYRHFVATPIIVDDLIVAPSAKNGPVFALVPGDAQGLISEKPEVFRWKQPRDTPDTVSPTVSNGLVYMALDNGILLCVDAKTGKQHYKQRTHKYRHRSSLLYGDDKVYVTAMDGTVTVVEAGPTYKVLATNKLDERIAASPIVANGTLYLRTHKALYAIRH